MGNVILQKGLLTAAIVIFLDQLSKWWFMLFLSEPPHIKMITPFFNLVVAWNKGVSFSMLASNNTYAPYLLSLLSLVIVGFIIKWLSTEKNNHTIIALGLIIGGAIGNIIDRLRFGAVFDFLDFYIGQYHWPAFNVADSAITIGAGLLIIVTLFEKNLKAL